MSFQQKNISSTIIITKCLCDPCPRFYTDVIAESILIECRDPRHNDVNHNHNQEQQKNGEKEVGNHPHNQTHHRIQEPEPQPDQTRIMKGADLEYD